jgi:hypothetical protein
MVVASCGAMHQLEVIADRKFRSWDGDVDGVKKTKKYSLYIPFFKYILYL